MIRIFASIFFVICAFILGYLLNGNCGRYTVYIHPTYRADQYLLDTKNGNIWHLVEDKDKVLIWEPMPKLYPQDMIDINKK